MATIDIGWTGAGGRLLRAIPVVVLGVLILANLVRGGIHAFAPDGGAHSIAGLDLTESRQTILSLFAVVGLHQIVLGMLQLFVLLWRRDLVAIALGYQLVETVAGLSNLYAYRTLPVPVPALPLNAALLGVVTVAFVIALLQPLARRMQH